MSLERMTTPWYREPWPWIVMAGPAVVLVAGAITTTIAFRTSDGLVADDYYKRGLMVNRVTERQERARAAGVSAQVVFNGANDAVRVLLASRSAAPAALRLTLVHPTRSNADQSIELRAVAPGVYEGRLRPPPVAAWRIALEDAGSTWRVNGRWQSAPSPLGEGRGEGAIVTLGRPD